MAITIHFINWKCDISCYKDSQCEENERNSPNQNFPSSICAVLKEKMDQIRRIVRVRRKVRYARELWFILVMSICLFKTQNTTDNSAMTDFLP